MPKKGIHDHMGHDNKGLVWDEEEWVWKQKFTPEFVKTLLTPLDGKKLLFRSAMKSFFHGEFDEGMSSLRALLYLYQKKGGKFMKKIVSLFLTLAFVGIAISSANAAGAKGFITPNDVPEGFVAYVRANAGQFLVKGDVIFVKEGLNPKIDGFVLSDDTEKVKEMISGSTDPNLSPVNHRKAGLVAYGWGSGFSYNAILNEITPPKAGTSGNGNGGGGNDGGSGNGSGDGGGGGS